MDRIEESRLEWQRAHGQLQMALAVLDRAVVSEETPEVIEKARAAVSARQHGADEALQRHITQLGKN